MNKLYQKSEIVFAIFWIILYVVGSSIADGVSDRIGISKLVTMNLPVLESLFYIISMICVGFLEELIFRGFLFKAMSKDNIKAAIIVSSITFGIGHILNLINGSGADMVSNLCQVCYATAVGFLCVIIFHRGKSLWPCILAHSAVNGLSVFANEANITPKMDIISAIILTVISVGYTLILCKTLPGGEQA